MPRISVPSFLGPSNTLTTTNLSIERSGNLYLEPGAPGTTKTPGALIGRPCLTPFAQVSDSPGWTIFYQDDRCFVVVGTTFAELFNNGTTITRGTVALPTLTLPASIVSNGTAGDQLLICSGGYGYVLTLSSNAFIALTTANFPGTAFPQGGTALMVEFMDGYGIVLTVNTREFHISALEDFTVWDPLDVAQRSEASDNLVGMKRILRTIVFLGTKTGETWYDNGDALFPFAPMPGVFSETGSISWSIARVETPSNVTLAWLSSSERGAGVLRIMVSDNDSKTTSTYAVNEALQASVNLVVARLFAWEQFGHTFIAVLVPNLPVTWIFDTSTGLWFDWSVWDPTLVQDLPWLPCDHAYASSFGNVHLAVDYQSGNIYQINPAAYEDSIV